MGRRWGKTTFAVHELAEAALEKEGVYWWVGPDYEAVDKGWWILMGALPEELISKQRAGKPKIIEFENGSRIYFRTASNPNSLRGEGLSGLVMDEAAQIDSKAWDYVLKPSLVDHKGWALFIGTPMGRQSWFNELYLHGMSEDDEWSDWESFNSPSSENPYLDKNELERTKKQMSDDVFRQEFMAEFLEDAGRVFRNLKESVKGDYEKYEFGKKYVMGVDLAKHEDYTVISVLNHSGHLVFFDRFNKLDYTFQKRRIVSTARRYDAQVLIDATGVGDPIFDDLRQEIRVLPYRFTNKSKRELIMNLSLGFDKRVITFPENIELITELEKFGYQISPNGNVIYAATAGFHEDCVISLALAFWQLQHRWSVRHKGSEVASVIY
ncbi:MAG: hypothetical protein IID12_09700 [Candidatus Marinimicrobia bacterium]|nr:hypothetical protein [Candidatus Neomarinimicrobiota bacterium]